MTGPSSDRATTCHCGQSAVRKHLPDQWEGRMDGYCDACASNRCDCYPDECPVKYPTTGPSSERTADADVARDSIESDRLRDALQTVLRVVDEWSATAQIEGRHTHAHAALVAIDRINSALARLAHAERQAREARKALTEARADLASVRARTP